MKIKMKQSIKGASNPEGTFTMEYAEGESYEMEASWQMTIAEAFVEAGFADLETKVDAPKEKKTAKKKAAAKKA